MQGDVPCFTARREVKTMKRMRKLFSLLLAFCLSLSLCAISVLADAPAYTVGVADSVSSTVTQGQTTTVNLDLSIDGAAYQGVYVDVTYDASAFTFAGVSALGTESAFHYVYTESDLAANSGTVAFAAVTANAQATGTKFATLTFTALSSAAVGGYDFDVAASVCYDPDEDGVDATTTHTINIVDGVEPTTYTITFVNWDGATLETQTVEAGTTPAYAGSTPTRASDATYNYTFNGWSPAIAAATANATYTAQYTQTAIDTGGGDTTGGGGGGGGGGGTGGGGGGGGGTPTTIIDDEVPLADLPVVAALVTPDEDLTVTAARNDDDTVTVSVTDKTGGTRYGVPVKVSIPSLKDGEVAIIRDAATGEEIDLVEKSLVEDETVYALVNGSAIIDIKWNAKPFTDVEDDDWFASATRFVSSHELFQGFPDGSFRPDTPMNRAMLVTVLYRLENQPDASLSELLYPDTDASSWYGEALKWGTENGVITGYDDGLYRPDQAVSRQEMALILYRYMTRIGYDTTARGDLSKFSDGGDTASWASEAVQWTVAGGIIGGRDDGTIDPWGYATRAEVAAMFQRLVTDMVK